MCGVFGVLHDPSLDFNIKEFERLVSKLEKRGPDSLNSYEFLLENLVLKFGHTRLSILDLEETGNQPMHSTSGRFSIIYNGEIYNHLDLRQKLDSTTSYPWKGTSDTETLLALFENYSVSQVLNKLDGMFSFILFDDRKKELIIARDFSGEKPLYISTSNNFLGLGSDLNPLKGLPGFINSIDKNSVEEYMKKNYIPNPRSIFKSSFKLPPGSLIRFNLGSFNIKPYACFEELIESAGCSFSYWWKLSDSQELGNELYEDEDSAINHLEKLLLNSVNKRLISDVPLGAFLSGGIDSSLIVSLMTQCSDKTKTFNVGFDFLDYDESIYAQQVANHLGTDHTKYICREKDFFELIPSLPEAFSEPFADSSQLPTMLVSRMAREEVKVALSGDAGDELFGGYNRYIIANNYWRYFEILPKNLRFSLISLIKKVPRTIQLLLFQIIFSGRFSGSNKNRLDKILTKILSIVDKESFYRSLTTEWSREENIFSFNEGLDTWKYSSLFNESKKTLEEIMMEVDFQTYLPDDILCKVDRSSMYYSLETRAPFLNKDLVTFATNMPLNYKLREGQSKWILRRILEKYVPSELFERPKQGFGIPVSEWMRGQLKDWTNDMLSDEILNTHGLFNSQTVKKFKEEHFNAISNNEHKLWSLIQFNQWYISNNF